MRINSKVKSTRKVNGLLQTVPSWFRPGALSLRCGMNQSHFDGVRWRCHKSYRIIGTNKNKDHSLLAFVILNESILQMSYIFVNKDGKVSRTEIEFDFCSAFVLPFTIFSLQMTYDVQHYSVNNTGHSVFQCKVSEWVSSETAV